MTSEDSAYLTGRDIFIKSACNVLEFELTFSRAFTSGNMFGDMRMQLEEWLSEGKFNESHFKDNTYRYFGIACSCDYLLTT